MKPGITSKMKPITIEQLAIFMGAENHCVARNSINRKRWEDRYFEAMERQKFQQERKAND